MTAEDLVTKSIRLTSAEADQVAQAARQAAASEAALMKKWVLDGLRNQQLARAVQAYAQGNVDLRAGAAMAGVSYNHFLQAVQAQRIIVLEDPGFLERLEGLAEAFGEDDLRDAARQATD
jgi:hypothetical protein